MPIYEFRCRSCGSLTTVLTLSAGKTVRPRCCSCGGRVLEKMVSRVAVSLSEESRLERLADPSTLSGLDENDPRSIARWMKKMGRELGEDLGEDVDHMVEEAMQEEKAGGSAAGDEPAGED